jgi:hypothetical protein
MWVIVAPSYRQIRQRAERFRRNNSESQCFRILGTDTKGVDIRLKSSGNLAAKVL